SLFDQEASQLKHAAASNASALAAIGITPSSTGQLLFVDQGTLAASGSTTSSVSGLNYANADLTGQNFSNQDLENANFSGATLTNANFSGANLKGANFENATLSGATFAGANVVNADFTNASGASLTAAIQSSSATTLQSAFAN